MNDEIYNKGREAGLSKKFNTIQDRRDYYGGYESPLGAAFIESFPQHVKVNGYATTPEWSEFVRGWSSVLIDEQEAERKLYKVDDFLEELKTLCKKYDVSIRTEDGYDPGYASIKNHAFEIQIIQPS